MERWSSYASKSNAFYVGTEGAYRNIRFVLLSSPYRRDYSAVNMAFFVVTVLSA